MIGGFLMKKLYVVLLILFTFFLFRKPVYAIEEYHYPVDTFHSNVTSMYQFNYIRMAYVSLSMTSPFINEFAVPGNYKTSDNLYPLYVLSKNLEVPSSSEDFVLGNDNPTIPTNDGITYIIMHGYGVGNEEDSIFKQVDYGYVDNSTKQYITQIALWLYLYQHKEDFQDSYCVDGACDFKNKSGNIVPYEDVLELVKKAGDIQNYQYLKYIPLLVEEANQYESKSSSLASLNLSELEYHFNEDMTLLTTDSITPTAGSNRENYLYYRVLLEDPNQYGASIVGEDGTVILEEDAVNQPFKVVVPLHENIADMNLKTITIRVKAYFKQTKVYEYQATTSSEKNLSSVLFGFLPENEVIQTSFNLYNFVRIASDNPFNVYLKGTSMILKNKNQSDQEQTLISSDSLHDLVLEDGDYLLCEEDGEKCVDFVIGDSRVISFREDDEQTVEVPDTAMFQSKHFYSFGIISILLGVVFVGYNLLKKNKTSE